MVIDRVAVAKQGDNALGRVCPVLGSTLTYAGIVGQGRRSKVKVKCKKLCFGITVALL